MCTIKISTTKPNKRKHIHQKWPALHYNDLLGEEEGAPVYRWYLQVRTRVSPATARPCEARVQLNWTALSPPLVDRVWMYPAHRHLVCRYFEELGRPALKIGLHHTRLMSALSGHHERATWWWVLCAAVYSIGQFMSHQLQDLLNIIQRNVSLISWLTSFAWKPVFSFTWKSVPPPIWSSAVSIPLVISTRSWQAPS